MKKRSGGPRVERGGLAAVVFRHPLLVVIKAFFENCAASSRPDTAVLPPALSQRGRVQIRMNSV